MSRAARLLQLIQALRRRRHAVAGRELAEELGVSLRTIYRDIATLQAEGAPISGEAGFGYVLDEGFTLPPLMFTSDELDAVLLGLSFVRRDGYEALAEAAADALAKIEAVLPPPRARDANAAPLLAGPTSREPSSHVQQIHVAIRHERRLRIAYVDRFGLATERIVWPIAVGFMQTSEMMAAWCETRSDIRHFRLDRIKSLAITDGHFGRRHVVLYAEWEAERETERD